MSDTTSFRCPIPAARKVSPLRQRMIDDMTVRNLAPNTMLCYLKQVSYLARYFGRSPAQLGPEQIREYQLYLAQDRRVSVSSRLVAVTALRFLYGVTLRRIGLSKCFRPPQGAPSPCDPQPGEVLRFWKRLRPILTTSSSVPCTARGCGSARPSICGLATSTASA